MHSAWQSRAVWPLAKSFTPSSPSRSLPPPSICVPASHHSMVLGIHSRPWVALTLGAGGAALATLRRASLRLPASRASRYRPPVLEARHWSCCSALLPLEMSKPITWAVKSTPSFSSSLPTAQGSAWQVSSPSETRMTVAFRSLNLSCSAAMRTDAEMGVIPLGCSALTVCTMALRSSAPGARNSSMSLQSPLLRWP